jgi:hypothetical protein
MQPSHKLYAGAMGALEHQARVFSRMTSERLLMLLALSSQVADPATCAMAGLVYIRRQPQAARDALVASGMDLLSTDLSVRPPLPRASTSPEQLLAAELAYAATVEPPSRRIILSVLRRRLVSGERRTIN